MFSVKNGETIGFGIRTNRLFGQVGEWDLKSHPLFSQTALDRNSMIIYEPSNLKVRYIDEIFYKQDQNFRKGGFNSVDAMKESYACELGWEFRFANTWGILRGIGLDNLNV